ncbi:MAG: (2Fe-2S)-binding protein [Acidimicrobiia bacterium]
MYVCSCAGVSDGAVKAAVDGGARSIEDLGERCGAGAECGGCLPALAELLASETQYLAAQAQRLVRTG